MPADIPQAPAAPTPPKSAQPPVPSSSQPPAPDPEIPSPTDEPSPPAAPSVPAAPTAPTDKGGKVNPWKLVDSYKARLADVEKKFAEAGKLPDQQRQEYLGTIEKLTKENERLENEMRFLNYQESAEFKEKFDGPYSQAWDRAMTVLGEIQISDPSTGAARAATAQDMADLLAMPLNKAQEVADEVFGKLSGEVMGLRRELKGLFSTRAQALKDAKEKGAERDKTQRELHAKNSREVADFIKTTWDRSNQELLTHERYGRYFAPVEGDQDGNQRLSKGFELVDRAFSESPADPRLTPEQRASVVKRHAAVRNRAAAFGRLVSMVDSLTAERDSLKAELAQYKESTPPAGGSGSTPTTEEPLPASASGRMMGELRKLAK